MQTETTGPNFILGINKVQLAEKLRDLADKLEHDEAIPATFADSILGFKNDWQARRLEIVFHEKLFS
jgi:hypothetical protein